MSASVIKWFHFVTDVKNCARPVPNLIQLAESSKVSCAQL